MLQVQQIIQAETLAKKLYKDTKKSLDSGVGLAKVEQRMLYELVNSSKQVKDAEQFVQHVEKFINVAYHTEDSQNLRDTSVRATFVQPLKVLCEKFPTIHSAVKRREQSQQEYSKYLSKRDKLARDASSTQSGKYDANEKYLERTRSDFDRRTKQLNEDVPKFLTERFSYFDPCFKAMVQSNLNCNEATKAVYDKMNEEFGASVLLSDEEFSQTTEKMLEDIRSLSIVIK